MTDSAPHVVAHPTREQRIEAGREARRAVPLADLAECAPRGDRDPVDLLEEQASTRIPQLVSVRYGRMTSSAFAFFRGAALVMADDLSRTPNSGLHTQLCGDAHLSNFGVFATPERKLAFDVNDFDETCPGPFEWDVKRLVASLAVAARDNGFGDKQCARITRACAAEYRETMLGQAERGNLAVWYSHIEPTTELVELRDELDTTMKKRTRKLIEKSRTRDSVQALGKLTEVVDGERRIISAPPLIVPIEEVFADLDIDRVYEELRDRIRSYRATLQWDRRVLLEQFQFVQAARKVVGVGSVGTRAWIVLMRGTDDDDPLFLQAKEAQPSVLSRYVDGPTFTNEGERVVNGQRLMQAASDIFLGWQKGAGADGVVRDFYIRQLRDGKGSAVIEAMTPTGMTLYGRLCGRVLGYAHARAGDRISIAAYLGSGTEFDDAMAEFADAYARKSEQDFRALLAAVEQGRVEARQGI
ncbi:MAG: DUF2252 domain-containing protein [Rhodococcus sp.]|uniref:DUF2252 domain-containing protein n=1 Tax=Rhodococcus TaxID=1827 RepID=UPI0016B3A7A9|nr:DUF2252 domain-containing protein [Rhodococcus sp. (in: high G+C Gram-positive bacteria)]NLV81171.1 DUF2252 domain-containing protein [Rhodococcus sp. (in: high G+C Gram-positive bacteria)]